MAISPALLKAKQQWCIKVVNTAKANLLRFGKVNTGALRDSIRFNITPKGNIRFFFLQYGIFVESGRRAGAKQPPINPILKWIEQRGIVPDEGTSKRSLAFLIARSIGEKGIRPTPFMKAAVKQQKVGLSRQLAKEIAKTVVMDFKKSK
jgi:hypothetical protein